MRKAYWAIAATACLLLVWLYQSFSPAQSPFFPKCPFLWLTGFRCPGCGSQRAIHALLNAEIGAAFRQNMLVVIFIPYIVLGAVTDLIRHPSPLVMKIRLHLFGVRAIWIVFTVIVVFAVLRNVCRFENLL